MAARLLEWHDAPITAIARHSVYRVAALPLMLWCPLPLSSHSTPRRLCVCWRSQVQLSDARGCVNQSPVCLIPLSTRDVISVIIKTQQLPLMKGGHTSHDRAFQIHVTAGDLWVCKRIKKPAFFFLALISRTFVNNWKAGQAWIRTLCTFLFTPNPSLYFLLI